MTDSPAAASDGSAPGTAVVIASADGVICFWSDEAERLTGHAKGAALGSSLDLIVPPDYRQRHWAGFRVAVSTGTARFEGQAASIPVLCADGTVRRWPGRFTLIRDARGTPACVAAVFVPPEATDPPLPDLR